MFIKIFTVGIIYFIMRQAFTAKVNQQTICEYFEATPQNKKKPNEWKIKCMLPQYAALVS